MHGDSQVRFCTHCDQKVYDISQLSREEASKFLAEATGRVCVRFYRRADGTIMTADCGRAERTQVRVRAAVVTAFTLLGLAAKFATPPPIAEPEMMGKIASPEEARPAGYAVGSVAANL